MSSTNGVRNVEGILERLARGPIVGDGSMCMVLEKRGYARAGVWTPEAVLLYPEAVKQLLREYLRGGADVLQTPCFYSSDGLLESRFKNRTQSFKSRDLNDAACKMAREVADEGDALVCGSLSPVLSYSKNRDMEAARKEFENQLQPFIDHDVDFVLAEFFGHVEEIELCVDVIKRANKPIAATMRIGPMGDVTGVSVEECAVRMAKTGADIIGINCLFDVNTQVKVIKRMKAALDKEGLKPYIMVQALGWLCPEVEEQISGYLTLPEAPVGMDARSLTRFDVHKFAREAWEAGAHYIGGCCGFEPHHVRAVAQELQEERGRNAPCHDMCPPFSSYLCESMNSYTKMKGGNREFWMNQIPGTGRPNSKATSELYTKSKHDVKHL